MPFKIIRRRGRSLWYMRGTINGVRYDESTGSADRKIADSYRLRREHEIHNEAIHGKAARATFSDAATHYVEHGGSRRFLEPLLAELGSMPIKRIGQAQLDAAASKLYPLGAGSTLNRQAYGPASAVLRHAAHLGWCPLPVIRRPKAPAGRVRWLTHDEAARLLASAAPHTARLLLFLLYTGCRIGEALWLDWSNIDLDRRQVMFIDTKNDTSRGVPLHDLLVQMLAGMDHRDGRVFRTDDGSEYTKPKEGANADTSAGTRIKTAFRATCRRAGVTNFHPHDCRHTWATWHYMANRDLGALMRLGGWKTMSMVMRYAHTNVDELGGTIDALPRLSGFAMA